MELKNIVVQISQDQHESDSERSIGTYTDVNGEMKRVIVRYEDLTTSEKKTYNAFKNLILSKIPE